MMNKAMLAILLSAMAFPAKAQPVEQDNREESGAFDCSGGICTALHTGMDEARRGRCSTTIDIFGRGGTGVQCKTHGSYENAAAAWVIANDPDGRPQVNGFNTDSQLATYADRDSVAFFTSNLAPAPTQIVMASSFTKASATLVSPARAEVVAGMIVDTNDRPKYSARITAISADRMTLAVSGWYRAGNVAAAQIPKGKPTLYINPTTKIWALNANATIMASSLASRAVVAEFGILNNKGPLTYGDGSAGPDGGANQIGGVDVTSLGTYPGGFGYIARGDIWRGFVSRGQEQYGFVVEDGKQNPAVGFVSEATSGVPFSARPGGAKVFEVDRVGGLDLGNQTSAIAPTIRLYSDGTATPTTRLSVDTGGNFVHISKGVVCIKALSDCGDEALRIASVAHQTNSILITGAGASEPPSITTHGSDAEIPLSISSKGKAGIIVGSALRPATNQVYGLGSSSFRWKGLFLAGPVVRSVTVVTEGTSYAAKDIDSLIVLRKTVGSPTTLTLPVSPTPGQEIIIKDGKGDAETNNITIKPASGTIEGQAKFILSTGRGVARLTYDGMEWVVL